MSINPKCDIHKIIQDVSESLESSLGKFDSKTVLVAREALKELSKGEITEPLDQIELMALASRICMLSQKDTSKIHGAFHLSGHVLGNDEGAKGSESKSLAEEFLLKAKISSSQAEEIASILSKFPYQKETILKKAALLIKKEMPIEERILILKEVQTKEMENFIEGLRSRAYRENFSDINWFLENLGIPDQAGLVEIAKIVATYPDGSASQFIKHYGITDEKDRIEIAKVAAANPKGKVSEFIKDYGITDENARIEIAKIAAEHPNGKVSEFIKDYGITDEKALIEIAKIAAARNGEEVSKFIELYGITDEKDRIEIAELAVKRYNDSVSKFIKNYNIKDQGALIKIAKIEAEKDYGNVSEYIKDYGITDENARIEIAKIAAAQWGGYGSGGVSSYIKKYDITDEKARIEIAEIEAVLNGQGLSEHIKDYDITDEKIRIKIAKIAAVRSGEGVSTHFKNYGITEESAIVEIAKIAATYNGKGLSERISFYNIKNQKSLVEIAKIAGEKFAEGVCVNIKNYCALDPKASLEIAKSISEKHPEVVLRYIDKLDLDKSTDEYKDLVLQCLLFGFASSDEEIIKKITRQLSKASFLFESDDTSVPSSEEKVVEKKKTMTSFDSCVQVSAKHILPKNDLWSKEDSETVLNKITSYRNKPIAGFLSVMLLEGSRLTGFNEAFLSLATVEKAEGEKTKTALAVHKILPSIIPAKWIALAKQEASLTTQEEKSVENLVSFLNEFRSEFRNNLSPVLQSFLLTAIALDKIVDLSSIKKLQILSEVCKPENFLEGLPLVRSLCSRKEAEALRNLDLKTPVKGLKDAFEVALLKDQFINLSGIDNLADAYFKKFENTRIPMAIETYTTVIHSLGDEEVRKTLERFVRSVLLDTFKIERYDTTKSPHLQQIQSYDMEKGTHVLENWKSLVFEDSVTPIEEGSKEIAFSFDDFFKQKLGDGHGRKNNIEQFSALSSFLAANAEIKGEIFTATEQRIKDAIIELKAAPKGDKKNEINQRIKMDQIQKSCMDLISNPNLSKKEQLVKLQNIASQVPSEFELKNDLKALAQNLDTPQKSSLTGKVELCSGWEDLFLAGTEVAGSCQRIDGDSSLNKCLLAYCLDGKNSMMAVKDESGNVLARSMLRLLWNETDSKPVLFLDRLYPSPCSKEREVSIKDAAIECAKKLGLELFIQLMEESPSDKTIKSLGGSCPYEYADGADGVNWNGVFTIKNARQVEITI